MSTHTHPATTSNRRHWMRWTLLVAALAMVAAACSNAASSDVSNDANPAETEGTPAPTVAFTTFDGESQTLAAFVGKPTVVNFWASWCPSCVAEMSAAFKPVQESLANEVTFVGMNIQDERSLANELLATTGVAWLNAEDPQGKLYVALGGLGMPFTVFLSPSGEVLDTHNGPLNESQLRDRIDDLLLG